MYFKEDIENIPQFFLDNEMTDSLHGLEEQWYDRKGSLQAAGPRTFAIISIIDHTEMHVTFKKGGEKSVRSCMYCIFYVVQFTYS